MYSWMLYWERVGNESIAQTLKNRQPKVIDCYQYEWQGEAIAWKDNYTFFTTSDSDADSEPPIYKYVRDEFEGIANISGDKQQGNKLVRIGGVIYLRTDKGLYSLDGRKVQ